MIAFKFPEHFLWGASTSAHQIEGAAYEGGKTANQWDDLYNREPHRFDDGIAPDDGIHFYHHYKEDIADMKALGLKSFRMSISWARIFPEDMSTVNPEGIQFYNDVIDTLLANGIEPMVDIYHWDMPKYIADIGGFLNPDVVEMFAIYAKTCFEQFGDRVKLWSTLNEPSVIAFSCYESGSYPPFHKDRREALLVAHHLILIHYKAVKLYRDMNLDGKIGAVVAIVPMYPGTCKPEDQLAAVRQADIVCNWWLRPFFEGAYPDSVLEDAGFRDIMPEHYAKDLKDNFQPIDFIGLNYYNPSTVKFEEGKRLNSTWAENFYTQTDFGFRLYPQGLFDALHYVKDTYNNPLIYITENGIGLRDDGLEDDERIQFIQEHLRSLARAIKTGVNVMGYYHWANIDTHESIKALTFKFGLARVDPETKARARRASWYYYKQIISDQAVN